MTRPALSVSARNIHSIELRRSAALVVLACCEIRSAYLLISVSPSRPINLSSTSNMFFFLLLDVSIFCTALAPA
ncbi:hypothetical protein Plhal304r1_c024g0082191 [Plasmopara halstedii]